MNVKTTFLHDNLEEEIYMDLLEGFIAKGKEDYVCKLKKKSLWFEASFGVMVQKV